MNNCTVDFEFNGNHGNVVVVVDTDGDFEFNGAHLWYCIRPIHFSECIIRFHAVNS